MVKKPIERKVYIKRDKTHVTIVKNWEGGVTTLRVTHKEWAVICCQ